MNIFFLDPEPTKIAEYHIDKHCVKMVLEISQLLCTAHHLHPFEELPEKFYKKTHHNHSSAIWARESIANYCYVCEIGLCLLAEYSYRYGKVHASDSVIQWCTDNLPDIPAYKPEYSMGSRLVTSKPALAMPDRYKSECPIESYRNYYINGKQYTDSGKWMMKYKNRDYPEWFPDWLVEKCLENNGK